MARTKTGHIEITCDGCPARTVVEVNAPPPAGWGRVTFEEFSVTMVDLPRRDGGSHLPHITAGTFDVCPKCIATLPWRRSP